MKRAIHIYFHNMVALAFADGDISEKEIQFLRTKADELKFDPLELTDLIKHAKSLQFIKPISFRSKVNYVEDFIQMIQVDGQISKAEIDFCKKICMMVDLDIRTLEDSIEYDFGSNPPTNG